MKKTHKPKSFYGKEDDLEDDNIEDYTIEEEEFLEENNTRYHQHNNNNNKSSIEDFEEDYIQEYIGADVDHRTHSQQNQQLVLLHHQQVRRRQNTLSPSISPGTPQQQKSARNSFNSVQQSNITVSSDKRKPTITKSIVSKHYYDVPNSPYSSSRYQQSQQLNTLTPTSIPSSPHQGKRTPRSQSPNLFFQITPSPSINPPRQSSILFSPTSKSSNNSSPTTIAHQPSISLISRESPRNITSPVSYTSSNASSPQSESSPQTPSTPRTPRTPRGSILPPIVGIKGTRSDLVSIGITAPESSRSPSKLPAEDEITMAEQKKKKKRLHSRKVKSAVGFSPVESDQNNNEKPYQERMTVSYQPSFSPISEKGEISSESDSGTPRTPSEPSTRPRRKSIRNYKKGDLIGQGANGKVFMSFDADNCQFFAVKEVTFANVPQSVLEEKLNSLQREITVMKSLSHVNIVQYYGAEKLGSTLDIFLEYVPGGSIASLIKRFGRLSEDIVKQFTKQILIGLLYLHENRIVHRDIKGANILINIEGVIKLADFGASKKIQDIMTMSTDFKSLIGTPNFMAPEVITQEGHGRPADIWSIGCTVMEMFTGKPPFSECTTAAAVMFKIASTNDPPMLADCISDDAKDFLLQCFERDQNKRPTTFQLLQHKWLRDLEVPIHGKGPTVSSLTPRSAKKSTSPKASPKGTSRPSESVQPLVPSHIDTSLSVPIRTDQEYFEGPQPVQSANPVIQTRSRRRSSAKRYDSDMEQYSPVPVRKRSNSPEYLPNGINSRSTRKNEVVEDDMILKSTDSIDMSSQHTQAKTLVLEEEPRAGYDSRKSIRKFLRGMSEWQSRSIKDMKVLLKGARKHLQEQENAPQSVERTDLQHSTSSNSKISPKESSSERSEKKKRSSSSSKEVSVLVPPKENLRERRRRSTSHVTTPEVSSRIDPSNPTETLLRYKNPRPLTIGTSGDVVSETYPSGKSKKNHENETKGNDDERIDSDRVFTNGQPYLDVSLASAQRRLLKPRSAPSRPQALSKTDIESLRDYERMFAMDDSSDLSPLSKQRKPTIITKQ